LSEPSGWLSAASAFILLLLLLIMKRSLFLKPSFMEQIY
jgi:hypothetical protein